MSLGDSRVKKIRMHLVCKFDLQKICSKIISEIIFDNQLEAVDLLSNSKSSLVLMFE